jgi:hypothetical protein
MAQVLHVEGLSNEVVPFFSVAPGESLSDLVHRLGGTCRIGHVQDIERPPTLSPGAAEFIEGYEREEPDSVVAVYWRYGSLEAEEFDTVEEAERYLDGGEEYDSLAGEAVVAADGAVTARP